MKQSKKEILLDEVDYYIRHGFDKANPLHRKYEKSESDEHFLLWLIDEVL